jgi:hypothetical protein
MVAPRASGGAAATAPAVIEAESPVVVMQYSRHRAAAATNGSAALKPMAQASAAEVSMMRVMTRRRPKRTASSLPSTLEGRPRRLAMATIQVGFQFVPAPP